MPTETYLINSPGPWGESVTWERLYKTWERSPRKPNGNLDLRANEYVKRFGKNIAYDTKQEWANSSYAWKSPSEPQNLINSGELYDQVLAESYAKLRGKLYGGSASLGVTLGSFKQSQEMVTKRYRQLTASAHGLIEPLGRRNLTKRAAGLHLEVIFGWQPLFSDIHAALNTVVGSQPASQYLTATARKTGSFTQGDERSEVTKVEWWSSAKRSCRVDITNPNLWLLERAGLLNPAAIAWDLVPWSFLVNMFGNFGSLVNSVTDYAGLSFSNDTTTRKAEYLLDQRIYARPGFPGVVTGYTTWRASEQYRTMGAVTRPPLVLKLPDVSWETAAMAASLFTQKISTISNLVSRAYKIAGR